MMQMSTGSYLLFFLCLYDGYINVFMQALVSRPIPVVHAKLNLFWKKTSCEAGFKG